MEDVFVEWDELSEDMRKLPRERVEEILAKQGGKLAPPWMKTGQGLPGAAAPNVSMSDGMSNLDRILTMRPDPKSATAPVTAKSLAGAAIPMATGAIGGGPIGSVLSGILQQGQDPFSAQGIAANTLNAAGGPILGAAQKIKQLGPFLGGIRDAAVTGGELIGTNQLEKILADKIGEQYQPMSGGQVLGASALTALMPPGLARIKQAFDKAPENIKAQLLPLIQNLFPQGTSAEAPPRVTPQITPQEAPRATGGFTLQEKAGDTEFTRRLNAILKSQMQQNPSLRPEPPPQQPNLEDLLAASLKARGIEPPAGAKLPATPITKPTVPVEPPPPIKVDLTPNTPESIAAEGLTAPPASIKEAKIAAAPNAELYSKIDAIARKAEATGDAKAFLDRMTAKPEAGGLGPEGFIDRMVSTPEGLKELPMLLRHTEGIFPNNELKDALRTKIISNALSGIGDTKLDAGPLARLKAFAGQDFDGKKGSEVINEVFGSTDAYRNLEDMHDIIEHSVTHGAGGLGKLRMYIDRGLKFGLPVDIGVGTITAFIGHGTAFGAAGGAAATAGAAAAVPLLGVKAYTLTVDKIVDMITRSRTKWADVLYDMAVGGNRHSAATINNIEGQIRRRASDVRTLTDEEARAEMERKRLEQLGIE